jgi:hypothetical protein
MEGRTGTGGFNARRNRNSILQTAGDALGIRLNKRKRLSRLPHAGAGTDIGGSGGLLADDIVLEISANKSSDYDWTTIPRPHRPSMDESAERERLRDAAAQAVGLTQKEDDHVSFGIGTRMMKNNAGRSQQPLPRYPSSLSALQEFVQTSSNLLKFYHSSSPFLILSRSKQWKTRYLILTTTTSQPAKENGAAVSESHLHLFKTASPDDKELERLSINQDSVVYMADEEVGGGRQFILKVGGNVIDAAAMKKEEAHPATWLLQMPDVQQMQRWIQFIKRSVLMQRYVFPWAPFKSLPAVTPKG